MSGWQDWAVALLLLLCAGRIVWGVCRTFRRAGRGESPCGNCPSCCRTAASPAGKRASCCHGKKKKKKSCAE